MAAKAHDAYRESVAGRADVADTPEMLGYYHAQMAGRLGHPPTNAHEAGFYVVHPELKQAVPHPVNDTSSLRGGVALRPQLSTWSASYSQLFKYEWAPTYDVLVLLSKVSEGGPFDGTLMHYVNHRRQHAAAAAGRAHAGAQAPPEVTSPGGEGPRLRGH
jgi:hypothetical protein